MGICLRKMLNPKTKKKLKKWGKGFQLWKILHIKCFNLLAKIFLFWQQLKSPKGTTKRVQKTITRGYTNGRNLSDHRHEELGCSPGS